MYWLVVAHDRPDAGPLRAETRGAHLEYLEATRDRVVRAGPLLTDDGATMQGSMLILDAPDRAAAEAWCAADPYAEAGLFSSVTVTAWREVVSPD